jgi:hypothetical protein
MADGIGNQTELRLILSADGTVAIAGMRQVQDATRQHVDASKSMLDELKSNWIATSAGILAAYETVKQGFDAWGEGARIDQARVAFNNATTAMAVDASAFLTRLNDATNGTVADSDLMQKSMKWMSIGFSDEKITQIAEIARVAARRMGVDVSTAFDQIGDGIEMMRSRALLSYGLITPEQVKLVNAIKSTGAEYDIMKLIMANVAVQEATLGKAQENSSEHWQQLKKDINEAKDALEGWIAKSIESVLHAAKYNKGGYTADLNRQGTANALGSYSAIAAQTREEAQDARAREQTNAQAAVDAAKAKDLTDQLNHAEMEWKKTIEALNPSLDAQAKQIQQLKASADLLKQTWAAKGQDTSWIDTGLQKGEEYIRQANAQKQAIQQSAEILKTYDAQQKAALENAKNEAEQTLKGIQDEIKARNAQVDLEVKYGQMTAAEGTEEKYQNELKLLEAEVQEKGKLVQAEVQYGGTQANALKMAEELTNAQYALTAAMAKRADVDREEYIQELQHDEQLLAEDVKRRESLKQTYDLQLQETQKLAASGGIGGSAASQGAALMLASAKNMADVATHNDPYSQALDRAKKYYNQMLQLKAQGRASQSQVDAAANAVDAAQDTAAQQAKLAMTSNTFGMLAGMAYSFYEMSGQQSRTALTAYKAMSMIQTVIDTYKAAMGAYSAMASIPYIGPALGAAAAAAAIAFGMARVQQISALQVSSAGATPSISSASASTAAYTVPSSSTVALPPPATTAAAAAQKAPQVININVYGSIVDQDKFARDTLPAIRKAMADGA